MPLATLLQVHRAWAWVVIIGNGMAGIWCLAAARLPSLRSRALWWFTAAMEAAVFVQVGMGIGLVTGEAKKAPAFHPLYGFAAVVAVGLFYAYRRPLSHRVYLLYGLGGLFVMGLGVRALLTATA